MVLSEYWKLVEEEERAKNRPVPVAAGLHRSGLSEEERELLETDPDLVQHMRGMFSKRKSEEQREIDESVAAVELDHKILAPIEEAEAKGRLIREWEAGWEGFVEAEEVEAQEFDRFLERCWAIEEKELEGRANCEEERVTEVKALYRLERQKCRYLRECSAWVEDWEEAYTAQWNAEREAHTSAVERCLSKHEEDDADDDGDLEEY